MPTLRLLVVLLILATPSAAAAELAQCEGALLRRMCEDAGIEGPLVPVPDPLPGIQLPRDIGLPSPSAPDELPELPIIGPIPTLILPDPSRLPDEPPSPTLPPQGPGGEPLPTVRPPQRLPDPNDLSVPEPPSELPLLGDPPSPILPDPSRLPGPEDAPDPTRLLDLLEDRELPPIPSVRPPTRPSE